MNRKNWVVFLPFYLLVTIVFIGIARGGSAAVTTISQGSPVLRNHKMIIDAGHGGIDGGATSCTGVTESTINLEIAMRLRDMAHFLGMDTVMIRETDISVYTQGNTIAAQKLSDLKERVRIVNSCENGILVSIHQNTFSDGRYSGAQVFYAENESSKNLAGALQKTLSTTINEGNRRQCKKAQGVYLMEHINATGVLIECGFLSNPVEAVNLTDAEYQKKLCSVIASCIATFLSNA